MAYIVGGLRDGFRVGFNRASHACVSAKRNMLSAAQHPEVIDAYLEEEHTCSCIIGPLDAYEAEGVHISHFGVIPKPHKPGSWQLILDLSHPEGASVNDGIDQELSSLSYVSVDDIIDSILTLGQGALLAKIDVRIRVCIKASKTDPFRKGVQIFLGHLCPVAALLAYVAIRGKQPGPLFCFASGAYLTRDRFVQEVRKALSAVGLDQSKYAGHSFHIGPATTAAAVGIEDSTIKTLGRWESAAYQLYVKLPREVLTSISSKLVKAALP